MTTARRVLATVLVTLVAGAVAVGLASPASAHVVPSTVIALDVHESTISASLTLPTTDLVTASGTELPDDGTAFDSAQVVAVTAYLEDHFHVTSSGGGWTVVVSDVSSTTTQQYGTATFGATIATATLTPPAGDGVRHFTLDYDAVIHQVVTADIFVVLHSDWAAGVYDTTRALDTIHVDTMTGTVPTPTIDLDDASEWQGFVGMVTLGVAHIAEGTDHQLFLLTLLLPAPLLAVRRRWSSVVPTRTAARRITTITIAFTAGHSVTLALGALGVPVPQQTIEALIAVSILVAAVHAVRPIFPGREALVAGGFGLIHGLGFSETLSSLGLQGRPLVLSLLGFNLGIELMQLAVVLLVLPPLLALARSPVYARVRVTVAMLTGFTAIGWVLARVGWSNPLGTAADSIGLAAPWVVGALWTGAAVVHVRRRPSSPSLSGNAHTAPGQVETAPELLLGAVIGAPGERRQNVAEGGR